MGDARESGAGGIGARDEQGEGASDPLDLAERIAGRLTRRLARRGRSGRGRAP